MKHIEKAAAFSALAFCIKVLVFFFDVCSQYIFDGLFLLLWTVWIDIVN